MSDAAVGPRGDATGDREGQATVAPPGRLPVAAAREIGPGRYRADVLVVGAGVAGLYACTQLPAGLDVIVLDKGVAGRSGSSPWAQGGIAVALGAHDSPAAHARDTLAAGDGLGAPVAIDVLTREAPARVADLVRLGAVFDTRPDATGDGLDALHLAREGAQSHARSVHQADATGAEMVRALRAAAAPRVARLAATAHQLASDADTGRVVGAHAVTDDGEPVVIAARAVLLASGGCGGLFAATTNPDHATGDGVALALRAGVAVRDLEFVQFHPTGLATAGAWRFLLTEALRGAGATLHDEQGRRFLTDVHPDAELAPRHVVASAILARAGGRAWLDATALGAARLAEEFPTVLAGVADHGFDLAAERIPVTPAAHYMVGGVRTDVTGRTSVGGLWAAGEVASTGVHGANRMAGNSLAEALVFGGRAAQDIGRSLPETAKTPRPLELALTHDIDLAAARQRLRETMWWGAGPVRDADGLAATEDELATLAARLGPPVADPLHLELSSGVTTARAIVAAAALRAESRGGHVRTDHPAADAAWGRVHVEQTAPR